jgi:hypothetical protein
MLLLDPAQSRAGTKEPTMSVKLSYPDTLARFLNTPELLPDENLKDFYDLYGCLEGYLKPETDWVYLITYQATKLTWDILRYEKMKVGMLLNHRRAALESLLRKIQADTASRGGNSEAALSEARPLAAQWFADPASRPAIIETFGKAGFPANAVDVEAFQLALPNLVSIERLVVSTQKRLDQYLKVVEKSSKPAAAELRAATTKVIDAHHSGRPLS